MKFAALGPAMARHARNLWFLILLLATATAGITAACSSDSGSGAANGAGAGTSAGGGDGGDLFNEGGGLQTLRLDPTEAEILVDNGVSQPVQLTAFKDDEQVYPEKWAVDYGTIAAVDAQGLVTASGDKGGKVTVTATYQGATASATIDVFLKKTVNPEGFTPDEQSILRAATDPDASVTWAYPYDGTVWPQHLLAPELMWNGSGAADKFYYHFTGEFVDLEVFSTADPPSRYQITQPDWIAINESGAGTTGAVAVRVARLPTAAASATVVVDHEWKMARGSLKGTVYYWANNLGRIIRIKPGQDTPDDFLALSGAAQGGDCTACHTVSANGSTMLIGGDVSWNTYDLLADAPTFGLTTPKAVRNWAMPAVSPNGAWVVENNAPLPGPPGGADGLWDTATGMKLAGSGLDGVFLDTPAFSPSGHLLAYADHGGTHDLGVFQFDMATGVASAPKTLITAGADPNLAGICFPSLSPIVYKGEGAGKSYVVYHRGTYPGSLDTRTGPGHLYMASADEVGIEWRLEATNGDAYPFAAGDRDRGNNYEPTFAPQAAGGYIWVVFTSRRTYGNRLTGGSGAVKQLWVAAIDPFPEPGVDPSFPAFWVRGQDAGTLNMRGYWALDPCVQSGDTCSVDADCCDGRKCEDGTCGSAEECSEGGGECSIDADCCDPELSCIAGVCETQAPQ